MDDYLLGRGAEIPTPDQYAGKMARMPNMKQRLEMAVQEAENRLADAKRAKEIFDAHPELEELLNIMQRGRF